jgi:hypothetical protein
MLVRTYKYEQKMAAVGGMLYSVLERLILSKEFLQIRHLVHIIIVSNLVTRHKCSCLQSFQVPEFTCS